MLENVKITKLENGACVATSARAGSNACRLGFYIPMGSRREKASEAGWSHFAEHMVLQGSKKYPSSKIVNRIMERFGGQYNAATSKLWTKYYAHVPAYGMSTAIDVLGDAIAHPLFIQSEVEKERRVILEEMKMIEDGPGREFYNFAQAGLWPRHPICRPIIGTPKSIAAIDTESLKSFHVTRYTSRGAMFIAVGNVDHDEIVERVRPVFDALSDAPEPRYRPASLDWPVKPVVVKYCDKAQATFQISFRGVSGADPRRHAQKLLASILGGDSSSRLYRSIRDRHGLAYSVYADAGSYTDYGAFSVSAGVSADSIEKALSLCGHELKELIRKPVGRENLARRREKFASLSIILNEDSGEVEYSVLDMCLKVYKKIVRPEEEVARIRSISAAELQALAAEIFRPENCSLALSLPRGCKASPEKLREALLNG